MAETKVTNDPKAVTPPQPTSGGATPATAAEAATPKRQKTPIPEGFVSPVEFARKVDEHLKQAKDTTKPQIVYGWVKNSKTFPSRERGENDFPRFIVNLAEGLKWVDQLATRRAEKAAKKAAAPTATPATETTS